MTDFHIKPRRSVLVVEPDPFHGTAVKRLLEGSGFDVSFVSTFDDASRLLVSQALDLLITSLRLGAYNGLHLVLRTRAQQPNCAAIVTTEFPDRVLEAEAERQSAQFLVRPFDDAELLQAVNRCFPQGAFAES